MTAATVEIGHANRTHAGESETGDRHVVRTCGASTLIGVIDGLGHGREAARAAAAAAEVLEAYRGESPAELMARSHELLADTRGAAMTIVVFDACEGLLKWVGAGNVAGVLLHTEPSGTARRFELLVRGGVVGAALPSIDISTYRVSRGDILVLATDGLSPSFVEGIDRCQPPDALATRLIAEYQTARDDALVVVARLCGAQA